MLEKIQWGAMIFLLVGAAWEAYKANKEYEEARAEQLRSDLLHVKKAVAAFDVIQQANKIARDAKMRHEYVDRMREQ